MNKVDIGFMRKGFANNSSSAHSLIFSKELTNDDGDFNEYFGWDNFVLSSVDAKKTYLFSTLYGNYISCNNMNEFGIITNDDFNKFAYDIFIKYIKRHKKLHKIFDDKFLINKEDILKEIDHQSLIALPLKHNVNRYLDKEFFHVDFMCDFFEAILSAGFVILGGNDNSSDNHYRSFDEESFCNIKTIWDELCGKNLKSIVCVKDMKTNYYVLKNCYGGITKVSFSDEKSDNRVGEVLKTQFPYLVDISITNRCEYNCPFCYMDSKPDGKHADFYYLSKLSKILRDANVFEIVLGGGEPSKYKGESQCDDISAVARIFKFDGFTVGMTTKNYDIHKESFFRDLARTVNSFAVSCTNIDDIPRISELYKAYCKESGNTRSFSIQYVLESNDLNYLNNFLRKCTEHSLHNITLLGAKSHGRGSNVEWHKFDDKWIEVVKQISESCYLSIGIDSVLAKKYRKSLIESGVRHYYLTGDEGKETCFIDAVEQKVSTSSFYRDKSVSLPKSCLSVDNFLEAYSKV